MIRNKYPGVSKFIDRHGHLRWRFRRKGFPPAMLPGPWGSPEFIKAYEAAMNGKPRPIGLSRSVPGSISAAIAGFYESAEFKSLKASTRRVRRTVLERFREKNGHHRIGDVRAENIRALLDKKADTPNAANTWLKCLKGLFRYAVDRGMVADDPTEKVKRRKIKTDGFHTWTEAEIATFEAAHPIGTRARLAFDLCLYTAQRRSDVIRLGPQHVSDGWLAVKQEKTGQVVRIPIAPELQQSIEACRSKHLTFLVTYNGSSFDPASFGNWFRSMCDKAGLPKGCSAHGLRKAAARRMAEAQMTPHQIMSVTGHRTLSEVQKYSAAYSREDMAEAAIEGLRRPKGEPIDGNPSARFANSAANPLKSKR